MRIKKGDQVKVITGSSKGVVAKVKKVLPKEDKLIVEGVHIVKKHMKPSQANPDGGISLHARRLEFQHPVNKELIIIEAPVPQNDAVWRACEA